MTKAEIKELMDFFGEKQGINESARKMSVSGMNDHPRLLVDDEDVRVFVDYLKRDVLGEYLYRARLFALKDLNDLAGFHLVGGSHGASCNLYQPFANLLLQERARNIL